MAVLTVESGCYGAAFKTAQADEECPNSGFVCVRVENSTELDFQSFQVNFNGQTVSYGRLPAGAISEYRKVNAAYRYAYTEGLSGERRFILQPIDFVGERHLRPGAYTYKYTVSVLDKPEIRDDWRLDGYLSSELIVDARNSK